MVRSLLQLTVFTAAPVVQAAIDVATVRLGLTRDTAADAGDGLATGLGNRLTTILAVAETLAPAQGSPGAGDRVFDAGVDLVLHGSILGPAYRHGAILVG
jgi:hypothetical protein